MMLTVTSKRCVHCERDLPTEDFRPNHRLRSGLHSWCRSCCVERTRQWRAENPEHTAIYNADRRREPSEMSCVECGTTWLGNYAGRKLCGSRACKDKRDRRLHPDTVRARERNRGHLRRLRASTGDLTAQDIRIMYATAKTCPLCGTRLNEKSYHPHRKHLDHIVPLNVGGAHTIGNVRVICQTCNLTRPNDASDVEQESLWARVDSQPHHG